MTVSLAPAFRFHDPENALAYERLLRAAPRTGRCGVWLAEGALEGSGPPVPVPPLDPLAVLEEWWPGPGLFPGLAPGRPPRREEVVDEAVAWAENDAGRARLVVGVGRRPADLLATLGWAGARRDLAGLVTVLRNWESRFGALVVRIGVGDLVLTVAAPPRTAADADRVAAEHVALLPGLDRRGYAARLSGARVWRLRWG
ncbi:DUF4253 domain-containing protein [Pseudonocardia xishanensis]|uniref:DUF4253 domain-containing protein n=1 Tax=Pseudonocardia xishanensis TaxID=630995 RepID=A0ABP8RX20_9PSEU